MQNELETPTLISSKTRDGHEIQLNHCHLHLALDPSATVDSISLLANDTLISVSEINLTKALLNISTQPAISSAVRFDEGSIVPAAHKRLVLQRREGQCIVLRKADGVSCEDAAKDLQDNGISIELSAFAGLRNAPRIAVNASSAWHILRIELTSLRIPSLST